MSRSFRIERWAIGALLVAAPVGCRQDMHDQHKVEPLERSAAFLDERGSRHEIEGTVARGELRIDRHLYEGKLRLTGRGRDTGGAPGDTTIEGGAEGAGGAPPAGQGAGAEAADDVRIERESQTGDELAPEDRAQTEADHEPQPEPVTPPGTEADHDPQPDPDAIVEGESETEDDLEPDAPMAPDPAAEADSSDVADSFPYAITLEDLKRGRERYDIFCSPCHARTGDGDGMVVRRGFRRPPSLHIDRLREAKPGHLFDVITSGFGAMPAYGKRMSVRDRWAIVAYIRALQLSQNARLEELTDAMRGELEARAPKAEPSPGGSP